MTTETVLRTFTITDGPTVDRIWDAAKYSFDKHGATVRVTFTTTLRLAGPPETSGFYTVTPHILGVQHEDGSGDSLIITGTHNGQRIVMYYKARRREGNIRVYA